MKKHGLKRLWKLKPSVKDVTDFYVFDLETGYRKGTKIRWALEARPERFIFGVIYGYNYTRVIHSLDEFIETLKEPRFRKRKIFAHNAGRFDLLVLFGNIFDLDPNAIFNGKFISATNGVCSFADSVNIYVGASIKKIGQMIGYKKTGMDGGNYSESDWSKQKQKKKDIQGCIDDCIILWEALHRLFVSVGDIKITQASLAMTYYRRFEQPFHIDHNQHTKHFWNSYYGGRTEALKKGKTHANVIDVNSMYPWAMRNAKFPNPRNLRSETDISIKKFNKYLQWYEGCVYATLHHNSTWLGFLPVKQEGKLLFPVGDLKGCWNFNEIRYALEKGAIEIKKIHEVVYSEPMDSPFVSFVDNLMAEKIKAEAENNEFERDRVKRLLNSLYGKFAQNIDEETIYIKDMEKQFHVIQEYQRKGQFIRLIPFNKERNDAFLVTKAKAIDLSYAIPSFSSYITSYARVSLLDKLLAMEKNKPVYCDTDSIFYEIDSTDIKSEKHLGGWKKESKIVTWIGGLKNYKFIDPEKDNKNVWRVKGVPFDRGGTTKIYKGFSEVEEVITVQQSGENEFTYYNLMQSKEALRRRKKAGMLTKRIKKISGKYDKRKVLDNGETEPILI